MPVDLPAGANLWPCCFGILFARCQQAAGTRQGFRFRNPLLSIDGTIIQLCATMFDWAKYQQTKGAAKLHLVLDHDGHLPCYAVITEGKTSELKVAREFQFVPGTILVFDRGYVDYQWYQRLSDRGVFFVTLPPHDADYRVLESPPIPRHRPILKDEILMVDKHYYLQ